MHVYTWVVFVFHTATNAQVESTESEKNIAVRSQWRQSALRGKPCGNVDSKKRFKSKRTCWHVVHMRMCARIWFIQCVVALLRSGHSMQDIRITLVNLWECMLLYFRDAYVVVVVILASTFATYRHQSIFIPHFDERDNGKMPLDKWMIATCVTSKHGIATRRWLPSSQRCNINIFCVQQISCFFFSILPFAQRALSVLMKTIYICGWHCVCVQHRENIINVSNFLARNIHSIRWR